MDTLQNLNKGERFLIGIGVVLLTMVMYMQYVLCCRIHRTSTSATRLDDEEEDDEDEDDNGDEEEGGVDESDRKESNNIQTNTVSKQVGNMDDMTQETEEDIEGGGKGIETKLEGESGTEIELEYE